MGAVISVIIFLIGLSLLMALGFLAAFLWAVRKGQYNDTYTPSVRILLDEEKKEVWKENTTKELNEPL